VVRQTHHTEQCRSGIQFFQGIAIMDASVSSAVQASQVWHNGDVDFNQPILEHLVDKMRFVQYFFRSVMPMSTRLGIKLFKTFYPLIPFFLSFHKDQSGSPRHSALERTSGRDACLHPPIETCSFGLQTQFCNSLISVPWFHV
jgi:hypothetical protein